MCEDWLVFVCFAFFLVGHSKTTYDLFQSYTHCH